MALLMVGFLLGGKLTISSLRKTANQILWISISAAIVTMAIVSFGLVAIGMVLLASKNFPEYRQVLLSVLYFLK